MLDVIGPMLPHWSDLLQVAAKLESPNPEDDLPTKAAIVGFSLLSQPDKWCKPHWQFVADYRASDLMGDGDGPADSEPAPTQLFACMAVGALLGALESERLTEEEFYDTLSQLPDYISLHTKDIGASAQGA